ncbi:hypothetical protein Esi_0005_0057 [Ectocarpus siliculosus]|uniref:Uncharacterized protein n=1 Tax=Ectocarpus siliculosus TaxID=2880 RepID=D8LNN5_ECTSI|nr:hypothetical protein Esi_0005_0057 [Ectocarpus siliculosus]|eukprot:CBN78245.1 hypothetical protein Esi_0005_0057 [Ectocarpus siliculosus]
MPYFTYGGGCLPILLLHTRHSGAVLGLSYLTEDVMVSSCYAASNLLGLIKFIKFLELAAANMLAITNLGICINLALIVSEKYDLAILSIYVIELFVGICMFGIVSWLLTFRMKEIKECWEAHIRIRYYFGLTLFGTAVNLGLGICGVVYIIGDQQE